MQICDLPTPSAKLLDMRIARYWLHLSACLFLVGCGSGAAPSGTGATAAARPPAIAARMTLFHCDSYPKPEHYTEKCVLTFKVDSANAGQWLRLGCFGELKFTQVSISDGHVQSSSHGFFEGTKQDHAGEFPPEFDLTAFVYFPKSYAALDPSLDWYKCEMLE